MKFLQQARWWMLAAVFVAGGCQQASREEAKVPTVEVEEPVRRAVAQLSSGEDDGRADSLLTLAVALQQSGAEVAYINQVSLMIQQNIAGQVRAMASVEDPEAIVRLAGVLRFNEALSRFVIDSMEFPSEKRGEWMAWALHPDNVQLIARVYGMETEQRTQAARELAKLDGPMTDRLIAKLIEDSDREVALTAMESAAERPATEVVVDALWDRAVTFMMVNYGMPMGGRFSKSMNQSRTVFVRGRAVQVYSSNELYARAQDFEPAADVLVTLNSPLVGAKLEEFFKTLLEAPADQNNYRFRVLSPNYGSTGMILFRLGETYKSKGLVPCLVAMATMPTSDGYNNMINNQPIRQSSRVDAMGWLVTLTGQDAEDYKLTRQANWGNRWLISGDEKTEEAQVKKVREWWGKNYQEYGYKDATLPGSGAGGGGAIIRGKGMRWER